MKEKPFLCQPVIYNLSLNVYRENVKKNKTWKQVSEIVGSSRAGVSHSNQAETIPESSESQDQLIKPVESGVVSA